MHNLNSYLAKSTLDANAHATHTNTPDTHDYRQCTIGTRSSVENANLCKGRLATACKFDMDARDHTRARTITEQTLSQAYFRPPDGCEQFRWFGEWWVAAVWQFGDRTMKWMLIYSLKRIQHNGMFSYCTIFFSLATRSYVRPHDIGYIFLLVSRTMWWLFIAFRNIMMHCKPALNVGVLPCRTGF